MEEKKKEFNPLASDWLMGNVGKEEEAEEVEEVEATEEESEKSKKSKKSKESKEDISEIFEDTVGFKNILEDEKENEDEEE